MFKLSFVYADWAEEGILLFFLFVLISRRTVFIARAKYELQCLSLEQSMSF